MKDYQIDILFNKKTTYLSSLISLLLGGSMYIKAGAYFPIVFLSAYELPLFIALNFIFAIILYLIFSYIVFILTRRFAWDISYRSIVSKLGYIGLPRLVMALYFYIYYYLGDTTKFTILFLLLVIIALLARLFQGLIYYRFLHYYVSLTPKKALLVMALSLLIMGVLTTLLNPSAIDHPYTDIIIKKIDL